MHSRYAKNLYDPKIKISSRDFKLYKFLAYLEYIRSYAWSFGHSDPDLSSVDIVGSLKAPNIFYLKTKEQYPVSFWAYFL